MTDAMKPLAELHDLLADLNEGKLTAEGHARIEQLVVEDIAARRFYLETMFLYGKLQWMHRRENQSSSIDEDIDYFDLSDAEISDGKPLSDRETSSSGPYSPIPVSIAIHPTPDSTAGVSMLPLALFSYAVAAVIVGLGLLAAWAWKIPNLDEMAFYPSGVSQGPLCADPSVHCVARITGTADCRWERKRGVASGQWRVASKLKNTNHKPLTTSHLVSLGDQFILSAGLMEITYNTGARVILQGPCTFEVDSANGGFLTVGKLTARVEKSTKYGVRSTEQVASGEWLVASESSLATNHYPLSTNSGPLFAVRTPTAAITDLGTEFGVEVDKAGGTTSHVFQGSVRVQTVSADGKTLTDARILHKNESARVECRDGDTLTFTVLTSAPSHLHTFFRALPKQAIQSLDLVDIVAGGDGFGRACDRGIDPTTGKIVRVQADPKLGQGRTNSLLGDGRYHRVEQMPLIDGVFIPQAGTIPTQLDSAGHSFSGFSSTDNSSWGHIWAGGVLPHRSVDGVNQGMISATIGFINYSEPGHSVLGMHPNKGITFDLAAIRQANPQYRIARFRAVAGNSTPFGTPDSGVCDIWVFVDGKLRLCHKGILPERWVRIDVEIDDQDRFLSLVTTDGGDTFSLDWVCFGDPQLVMAKSLADGATETSKNE